MRLLYCVSLAFAITGCASHNCPSGTYIDASEDIARCCSVQDSYSACLSANEPQTLAFESKSLDELSKAALAAFLEDDIASMKHLFKKERIPVIQKYQIEHAQNFGKSTGFTLKHAQTEAGLSQRYFRETHTGGLVHECAVFAHGYDGNRWIVITVKCQ